MEKNTLLEPIIDLMWEPEEDFAEIAPTNDLWVGCGLSGLCTPPPRAFC